MSNAATAKTTNGKASQPTMEVKKQSTVENAILSLEKRIQEVEELNIVIEKWRKLNEAKRNLTGFKLGSDGLSSTVVVRDVSGRSSKPRTTLWWKQYLKP